MNINELPKSEVLAKANAVCKDTLMETLDIELVDFGEDFLVARMPVTKKVYQPDGILHGGATVALAESVGSFASNIFLHSKDLMVRGIEISANHLKSVKSGFVYAKATFVHKGKTTQLLDIRVTNEQNQLISVCKLSTISLPKRK
ncbi:MAG: PaaI family thioesterase [Flavobacteriaceae bacterium]